jgi:hypothetical protein
MKEAKAKPGMKAMMIPRTKNVRKAGNAARRARAKIPDSLRPACESRIIPLNILSSRLGHVYLRVGGFIAWLGLETKDSF